MKLSQVFFAVATLVYCNTLCAEDVARFRGVASQGKYNETGLLKSWPEGGLTPIWVNNEIGEGWGSVVKIKDRLYLTCSDPDDQKKESVLCLDIDGKKIWQRQTGSVWNGSYPSPRVTPTYVAGENDADARLLVLCGSGDLYCLAASDGEILWNKEIAKIYETRFGGWGMAEAVVVKDGIVFVTSCGKKALAVALKVADGEVVWESPAIDDGGAYVTPIIHDDQLVVMTQKFVTVLDVKTGKHLWSDNYAKSSSVAGRGGIICVTPVLKGNQFFVSGGYDQGGVMYEILPDGKGLEVRWASKVLDTHHGGVVEHDGKIYGSNWLNNGAGNWVCLDWNTGETVYEKPWERLGKGAIVLADDMLYVYEERRGTLGLLKPGDDFEVVSSFIIDFGTKEHWSHPVVSNGILYVRHGNALAAFEIKQ